MLVTVVVVDVTICASLMKGWKGENLSQTTSNLIYKYICSTPFPRKQDEKMKRILKLSPVDPRSTLVAAEQ